MGPVIFFPMVSGGGVAPNNILEMFGVTYTACSSFWALNHYIHTPYCYKSGTKLYEFYHDSNKF
jgi:hypothetical protein